MPPLGRAARDGVLHAVAGEDFDGAVVHADRDVDDQLARRVAKHLPDARIEIELPGGEVEARRLRLPGVRLLLQRERSTKGRSLGCGGARVRILLQGCGDQCFFGHVWLPSCEQHTSAP